MSIIDTVFKYKKAVQKKLLGYGFIKEGESLVYRTHICDNNMLLTVTVDKEVRAQVCDAETGEPYTLHLVEGAAGEFVGRVRGDYVCVLEDIAGACFEKQVFCSAYAAAIIEYARQKYGSEAEFLWADTPDCAVLRRNDTGKWYAAIMVIPYRKLGVEREGAVEIIDMKMDTAELEKAVDGKTYFLGWHMNKKHWVTMLLDGSAPYSELVCRLDASYALAVK